MKYDYYITGTIGEEYDWWTGQRGTTSSMVKEFLDKHKGQEVNIAVCSPGGYLMEGLAIAELVSAHGNCNMIIVGMTASSATVLCMKAKTVKIARGSLMLIHNSSQWVASPGQANKQKIDSYIDQLKKTRDNLDTIDKAMADLYSSRNKKTIEENCEQMNKERWMSAQDALDFGIVDGILDEEEVVTQTKAVQNVLASYEGIEQHFQLPAFPKFEKPDAKKSKKVMAKLKELIADFTGVMAEAESIDDNHSHNPKTNPITVMNKTFVRVNALLKVEGIDESNDGLVVKADQMQVIEDNLAVLQGKVENNGNLESQLAQAKADKKAAEEAKATAEQAKAAAETKLASVQKELDELKAEAGDKTPRIPVQSDSKNEPVTAKQMYDDIKNLL